MKDTEMSTVNTDLRVLLREAEKAYNAGDMGAFGEISKQIPAGCALVILKSCEHGPCFTILPIESVPSLTARFRIVTINEPVVSSIPVKEQEANSEPDRPTISSGFRSDLEPGETDGRGNL